MDEVFTSRLRSWSDRSSCSALDLLLWRGSPGLAFLFGGPVCVSTRSSLARLLGRSSWFRFLLFGADVFVRWLSLIWYLYPVKCWLSFEVWERGCCLGGNIFKNSQIFDPDDLILVFNMDLVDGVAVKSD